MQQAFRDTRGSDAKNNQGRADPPAEKTTEFCGEELMFIEAARLISGDDVVIVGSGIAFVVAMLAQRTHASNVSLLIDSGAIDPWFECVPESVSEARAIHRALRHASMREVLGPLLHRGGVTALLGAAEVDQYGNVNSSYVQARNGGVRRLVGSGGATAMLACAARIVIPVRHEPRRFPRRCQYVSSVGYLSGGPARNEVGLHEAGPDIVVVTDHCIMRATAETRELTVTSLMPGYSLEDAFARTEFRPLVSPTLTQVEPPSQVELRVLRDEVDPHRIYLKCP